MLQKASLTFFTFHAIPQIKIIRKKLHIGYTKYSTKQKQENKSTLRCASLRGVEFFPYAAQGGFVLLFLFITG